jgi:hypothetical protein
MLKTTALILFLCAGLASGCSRGAATLPPAPRTDEAPRWQSQGHLAGEDRERQLARDRHALADHQAIVALLVMARREPVAGLEPQVEQHLARINAWGNVSPVTATYRSMLAGLREESRPEWDRQLTEIRSYLHEVAESEGEGE